MVEKSDSRECHCDTVLVAGVDNIIVTDRAAGLCYEMCIRDRNIGMMAMKIVFRIYDHYQDEGTLSETVSLYY